MSENEFELIQGNSYRGSRYSNFVGGGLDAQGNVSSGQTENSTNTVGTNMDMSQQPQQSQDASPTPMEPSRGLTDEFQVPSTSELVIGGALPFAGTAIGQVAGTSVAGGASFGEGVSRGASALANRVSGGLIGTAATSPVNAAAAATLGNAAGPPTRAAVAAASKTANVGSLGSGANLGAAAGAGFATAAVTLLSGGSVKDAVKSGAGTAAGTAIGAAIGGSVGGPVGAAVGKVIGGFVGGLFCFAENAPILMADGTQKLVQDIEIGDQTLHGGMVIAAGKAFADDLYEYKNTVITSYHAVFEDGKWIRAEDSALAVPVKTDEYVTVYPIATEQHILLTPWYISADLLELDESVANGKTSDEIIDTLNSYEDRNKILRTIEKDLPNE